MNTNEQPRHNQDAASEFAPEPEQLTPQQPEGADSRSGNESADGQQLMRRNLDTGEDEPFDPQDLKDKSVMDFGSCSGGGAAGDGGGA